jgi:predicted O-methyltransferase YrrM
MCRNIFTHPESEYFCVDTFEGSAEHKLKGIDCSSNLQEATERLSPFYPICRIYRRRSNEFLETCLGDERLWADFIYVDAAHDAMNVMRDAVLSFDLLKVGGVLVFDDYRWTVMPDELDRPAMAIDAFITCYSRQLEVLDTGWQVAVKKIGE